MTPRPPGKPNPNKFLAPDLRKHIDPEKVQAERDTKAEIRRAMENRDVERFKALVKLLRPDAKPSEIGVLVERFLEESSQIAPDWMEFP